jgi:hypothetical protein
MRCAVSSARGISSAASNTSFSTPHSCAFCASNGRPVRITSRARRSPIARGRFWVPPAPGMIPIVTSVRANRAWRAA